MKKNIKLLLIFNAMFVSFVQGIQSPNEFYDSSNEFDESPKVFCERDVCSIKSNEVLRLHLAAFRGLSGKVRSLLRRGVEVDRRDQDGWTALHVAVKNTQLDVVGVLINGGANPRLETCAGLNAFDLALDNTENTEAILKLLDKPEE